MGDYLTKHGKMVYVEDAFDDLGVPAGPLRSRLERSLVKKLNSSEITLLKHLAHNQRKGLEG